MKNDNTTPIDIAEHSVVRQARLLDKEMEPERDLWPEIADRVRFLPQQELNQAAYIRWMPMAMAACMLVAIGSLGFAGYINYSVKQQIVSTATEENIVDLIDKPFMVARTSYLEVLVTEEQQMSPQVREVLTKNLKIIDDAASEIRKALKENPNDPFLTDALILTHQKELQLLNQMTNQNLGVI